MQPNEQPQHPIDYLDSISTAPKKPAGKVNDKVFFGVIIAGVLVTILVGVFAFLSTGTSSAEDMSRLSVRLENLQTISDNARKTTISSSLRATNINLSLALTNANRDIAEHLAATGIDDPKKINPAIITEENTDELTEKLEDARLNAIFDRTYAREMSYQLETLLVLIQQTETKVKENSAKEFLSKLHKDLESLQKQFSNFSASS